MRPVLNDGTEIPEGLKKERLPTVSPSDVWHREEGKTRTEETNSGDKAVAPCGDLVPNASSDWQSVKFQKGAA